MSPSGPRNVSTCFLPRVSPRARGGPGVCMGGELCVPAPPTTTFTVAHIIDNASSHESQQHVTGPEQLRRLSGFGERGISQGQVVRGGSLTALC